MPISPYGGNTKWPATAIWENLLLGEIFEAQSEFVVMQSSILVPSAESLRNTKATAIGPCREKKQKYDKQAQGSREKKCEI